MRYLLPLVAGAALVAGLASPAQAATGNEWSADLHHRSVSWGGSPRMGLVELEPHTLARPANTVTAVVTGDGVADVRGLRPDGQWTEWMEAPATLPVTTSTVQTRVVLNSGKAERVQLTATNTPAAADVSVAAAGRAYRVYATREGLVGATTANGHTIRSRDHFVALPSRRGLAPNNSGSYSVQLCASNGRCEWAPVWDVGPWNTKDDYWNPSSTREMWKDLPQGKPEAQAAYEDGYNGGKDQSGRRVANPAGIDLADGTFLDGLKLTTNSWVTVTYLWTGSGPVGTVRTSAANGTVNVRSAANSDSSQVGLAANYAQVRVTCQLTGESVTGTQGTSNVWYRIASGKHIAKAYVAGVSGATSC
ncbi:SH3 domain-containing protein [Lentzea sp. NPDC004782]|uniref:SH3 domain-containing protein n=1 Tax=Lentzea sp. NPDC004782 TaxID=3154458 RepID=UPI0033BA2BCF